MATLLYVIILLAASEMEVVGSACSSARLDIQFLLDCSGSTSVVGKDNYKKQLGFVNDFVANSNIGRDAVQVGVTIFSIQAFKMFLLNEITDSAELQAAVDKSWSCTAGPSRIDSALDFAFKYAFKERFGGREDAKDILIVMTNATSSDEVATLRASIKIHQQTDISVFVIGVGASVDQKEMQAMATTPEQVYSVANFGSLDAILGDLVEATCHPVTLKEQAQTIVDLKEQLATCDKKETDYYYYY